MVNLPSKLTNKPKKGTPDLFVVSKEGSYQSANFAKAVVNMTWLNDCISKRQIVTKYDKYGFVFTNCKFFIYEQQIDDSSLIKQTILN